MKQKAVGLLRTNKQPAVHNLKFDEARAQVAWKSRGRWFRSDIGSATQVNNGVMLSTAPAEIISF